MEKMRIPDKIRVGYQNRNDTYTGKLAYVIYYDEKNKLRKETSWQGWRDNKIDPNNFDNIPTEGFVLNKGVGGARQSWGWNPRNEYIRVFDPRGFEFEISVANLLFILQECTSVKGKGLEGEFVYAWDGKDLVLLPVGCYEYNQSKEFTANKSKKVTKDDMVAGRTYLDKNGDELIYIGREKCRTENSFGYKGELFSEYAESFLTEPTKFHHVFYNLKHNSFEFHRGFTRLALVIDTNTHPDFLSQHNALMQSAYVSNIIEGCVERVECDDLHNFHGIFKYDGKWYVGSINGRQRRINDSAVKIYECYTNQATELKDFNLNVVGGGVGVWADNFTHIKDKLGVYRYNGYSPLFEVESLDGIELYFASVRLANNVTMKLRRQNVY